jgi:tetratricopeptide (TPR) repeat protein
VSDGFHLWSEVYDRTLEDIFAVQDDIAQSVVKELRGTLLDPGLDSESVRREAQVEVAMAARGRGSNAEAHRLALQGRHMIERLTREDVLRGMQYLHEALRLDPSNARAWVDLARAHTNAAGIGWENRQEGAEAARSAVEQALTIEPDLPEAYNLLGRVQIYFNLDWKAARESYRRATELAPGIAVGRHGAGILAQNEGRWPEALDLYRRAVDQDPLSAAAYHRLGTACLAAGLVDEAEFAYRRSIELAPQRVFGHASLGLALLARGRLAEALEEAMKESESVYRRRALVAIYHASGQTDKSEAALRTLIRENADSGAFQIAEAYASRSERDQAFQWLERARVQRDPGVAEITGSSLLKSLHDDPRWSAFLKKIGITG